MKLAILINDVAREQPEYATTVIARAAAAREHEVWYLETDGFIYGDDERLHARARRAASAPDAQAFVAHLQHPDHAPEHIVLDAFDVLLLRNNPAEDADRPWARAVGLTFGQAALQHGVIVLNDPDGLARGQSKLYFQGFPERVRPRTLIARSCDALRAFIERVGDTILKPTAGSGGQGIFLVKRGHLENLNQIFETLIEHGYVIAQEYLPAAAQGDIRLFLLNGRPLCIGDAYAAIHRVADADDIRSNTSAGGSIQPAQITDDILAIADAVRPKIIEDGLFLVGLDIAGEHIMEINVFSPGGLHSANAFSNVDFGATIVEAIERKVHYVHLYKRPFDNRIINTL